MARIPRLATRLGPLALALSACSAADELGGQGLDADGGGVTADAGLMDGGLQDAGGCAPGEVVWGARCVSPPPPERLARCAWLASLGLSCEDRDGDCHPGRCAEALPPELSARLLDCDDQSLTVHPSAPERCGGGDEDCDGSADEGFAQGACEACNGPGRWQCDPRDDRAPARCAPETPVAERCDGLDEDCDGRTDEACRVGLPAELVPARVAVCAEDRLLVADAAGRLHWLVRGADAAWQAHPRDTEGRFADHPVCQGEWAAWIGGPPGEGPPPLACAGGDAAAPLSCERASVYLAHGDEPAQELTGLERPGPPSLDGEAIRWHSLVEGAPVLKEAHRQRPGVRTLFGGQALSDASPVAGGRQAFRAWTDGVPRLAVRDLRPESAGELSLDAPAGAPLPPALGARWLVHARDTGALWALDLTAAEPAGFQFTGRAGPHRDPHLAGDRVYWLDGSEGSPALRAFHLLTGSEATLAEDLPAGTRLALGAGWVAWTTPGETEPALYLDPLPGPTPDGGPLDAGPPLDGGPNDGGPLDAGDAPDAGTPDAGAADAAGLDVGLDAATPDMGIAQDRGLDQTAD